MAASASSIQLSFVWLALVASMDSDDEEEASSDELEALYGPVDLPGNGRGTITGEQRAIIKQDTRCSAAVRKRDSWDGRKLTIFGPSKMLNKAKIMAKAFILDSETHGSQPAETPGCDNDPSSTANFAAQKKSRTERRRRKRMARGKRDREALEEEQRMRQQQQQQVAAATGMQNMMAMMQYFANLPPPPGLPQQTQPSAAVKKEVKKERKVVPGVKIEVKKEKKAPKLQAKPPKTWQACEDEDELFVEAPPEPILMDVVDSDDEEQAHGNARI